MAFIIVSGGLLVNRITHTDVSYANTENESGNACSSYDGPKRPIESTTTRGYTQKRYRDATFDEHGADGIEVFRNIEDLKAISLAS